MTNDFTADETAPTNEEITSTNEEHHDDTTSEGQDEETITLTKAELDAKLAERAKEQDKRWKERVGKKEEKGDAKKGDTEIDRMFLDTKGVETDDEQDVVLDFAKKQGISVRQALKDDFVQFKLDKMRKQDKQESSVPAPNGRGKQVGKDIDYYVRNPKVLAPTSEMRKEVRKRLSGK